MRRLLSLVCGLRRWMTSLSMDRDRMWKGWLMACIIGAHVWVGWTLAHYRPDWKQTVARPRTELPSTEPLLVLTFQSRARGDSKSSAKRPKFRRPPRPGESSGIATSPATAAALPGLATDPGPQAPLNLAAPADPKPSYSQRDVLQHRSALEYRGTRFDNAWMSDGALNEVLARRSKIAGALLGALGALKKLCTEEQRARYDSECVPDQYVHPGYGE
jgi:hypothetical protein